MADKDSQPVVVSETEKTFEFFINRPYVHNLSKDRLSRANALMVPNEGYADREDLVYLPSGSAELFRYLRERSPEQLRLDSTIEDRDYKELALHADWLNIATLVATIIVLPTLINLLSDYIYDVLQGRTRKTKVRSRIIVVDQERNTQIEILYEGPAETFRDTLLQAVQPTPAAKALPSKRRLLRHKKRTR